MSYTKDPHFNKNGGSTRLETSVGAKRIKCQELDFPAGGVADIGKAPTSRVYTRNYNKGTDVVTPENSDLITVALGKNPFRI